MPSRTIRPTQTAADAPFAYTVGGVESLTPEAVYVEWDGTGAGGAFRPCVSYYSSEGVLLDRAFPPANTIAPGLKASVSYRPFNRSDGASTPPPTFVPAVARAHVTGAPFTVPGNNAQVPLTFDFLQNVTAGINQFSINVSGWYLLSGLGGWIRTGLGGIRDRVAWAMIDSGSGGRGVSLVTIEDALGAGVIYEAETAVATPLFLQAADSVQVWVNITDQSGVAQGAGSITFGGVFALYQLA